MNQLTLQQLEQQYFYKTELMQFCRERNLPTTGTKADLFNSLVEFFNGNPVPSTIKQSYSQPKSTSPNLLSLNTPLIDPTFKFNKATRTFLATALNQKEFHFTKKMAALRRKARKEHDSRLTIQDLLTVNELSTEKLQSTSEEQTYQWNHFVKDFCQDPETNIFPNKLATAAILWKHVKQQPGTKKFSADLLQRFSAELRPLQHPKSDR
ncbi:SAP domain-containing protein [Fructilactobacillus carniphilus]|uniref:SAP domain-containing protein n=1 Tax=Fructilactobacillus carniphilus TaxID=2940297 RepID=A0ABY5C1Z1_9LACO|nr:SAP domain-containing protein [Fructilactobacillus carniphilus]USS91336.1 SAP domain-containing protein [Fructilactobacillus carniphilus]